MRRFPLVLVPRGLAVALLGLAVFASVARAAETPAYDHHWQVQQLLVGEAGGTEQTVVDDAMTLTFAENRYAGTVSYSDVLGVTDGSTVSSQLAKAKLDLTGTPLSGGSAAGGTFTGTITLTTRSASSLAEAASKQQLTATGGDTRTYDVAGHWAANLSGPTATGEILYQTATPRGGSGPVREVAWFNRVAETIGDPLGAAQTFTVAVAGVPARAGTSGGSSAGSPGTAASSGGTAPSVVTLSPLAYIARGFSGLAPVAPVPASSAQVRAAQALRTANPSGATSLPADAVAIDLDVAGAYLDAKNRAAGLLGDSGPIGSFAENAVAAVARIRAAVPATASVAASAGQLAEQLVSALKPLADAGVPGARLLAEDVRYLVITKDKSQDALVRAYISTVRTLGPGAESASLLAPAVGVARAVASSPLPRSGPAADAVLAAADDPRTPSAFAQVARMTRDGSLDAATPTGAPLPARTATTAPLPLRVLSAHAATSPVAPPTLSWEAATGPASLAPPAWLAYRRGDGTLFWLASPASDVALRDSSLAGWAFASPRAALVSAGDAGRVYQLYPLP